MGFQTPQYKLARLLEQAGDGSIQLPDFQRAYKWDEERIRSLLVTITLGYPLGVIMMLAAGNDQVRFKPKPLAGTPSAAADTQPDLLLLDGQQRLTSLYQAFTGSGVVDTEDVRGKQVHRRFYLNIDKALGDPTERDDAVVTLPEDGKVRSNFGKTIDLDASTPDGERANGLFPLRLVFDQGAAMEWLFAYPDHAAMMRFQTEVVQPMLAYQIPAIELDKSTTKGAVATVFEKVNTGGLPLNVFELLTATYAGDADYYDQHGTDFRLNDDWQDTQHVLHQHPVLAELQSTDFLQAVTLLETFHAAGATSARKSDILKLALSGYLAWAEKVRYALVWVAQFFDAEHIHAPKDVPYPTQIVPLAVIRVLLGNDADLYGVRERIRQWFWCGVLGELYGSTTETRFARDVEQVPPWARAALSQEDPVVTPITVQDASFFESRLESLRRRNSAAYKGIYALLMSQGCRDWKEHKSFDRAHYLSLSVDIHHVFPQKWCIDSNIDPNLRESVVNKTPLAASTNRFIGGVAPSKYLPKLTKSAGVDDEFLDAILRAHLIQPELLRADDFGAYFLARRSALLDLVESAMGKLAQRDVQTNQLTGGEESSGAFAVPDELDLTEPDEEWES